MKNVGTFCFLGLSWGLGFASSANAAPITYEGVVPPDSYVTGTVHGTYTYNDPNNVSYWSFYGNFGDQVVVTMTRNEADLDPAFWLFEGLFLDTTEFDLDEDGKFHDPMSRLLAFGDEDIEDAYDGPFMDAQVYVFLTLPDTGAYTIAAGSYASEYPDDDGYQFTLEVIGNSEQPAGNPFPSVPDMGSTLPMIGTALLGLGALRTLRMPPRSHS